jgi:predicted TIM-barrel fold metal-dependent hydrolase
MDAINFVGSDKIIFGTDTPYGCEDNIKKNLNRIRNLDISSADKELILGKNMKRLLKI